MAIEAHLLFTPYNTTSQDHVDNVVQSIIDIDLARVTTHTINTFIDVMIAVTPATWSVQQLTSFILGASVYREAVHAIATPRLLWPSNPPDGLIREVCALELSQAAPFQNKWDEIVRIFLDPNVDVLLDRIDAHSGPTQHRFAATSGQATVHDIHTFVHIHATLHPCHDLLGITTNTVTQPYTVPWIAPQLMLAAYNPKANIMMFPEQIQAILVRSMAGPTNEVCAHGAKLSLMPYMSRSQLAPCATTFAKCLFLLSRIGYIKGLVYTELPNWMRDSPRKHLAAVPFVITHDTVKQVHCDNVSPAINHATWIMNHKAMVPTWKNKTHDEKSKWRVLLLMITPGTERLQIHNIPYNHMLAHYVPPTGSIKTHGAVGVVVIEPQGNIVTRRSPIFLDDIDHFELDNDIMVCVMSNQTQEGKELINYAKINATPRVAPLFCPLIDGAIVLPTAVNNQFTTASWFMHLAMGRDLDVMLRFHYCGLDLYQGLSGMTSLEIDIALVTYFIIFKERFEITTEFWTDMHRSNILVVNKPQPSVVLFSVNGTQYSITLGTKHIIAIDYGTNFIQLLEIRETINDIIKHFIPNTAHPFRHIWTQYGDVLLSTAQDVIGFTNNHLIPLAVKYQIVTKIV